MENNKCNFSFIDIIDLLTKIILYKTSSNEIFVSANHFLMIFETSA